MAGLPQHCSRPHGMLGNDPEEMIRLALCLYLAQGAGTVSAGG